MAGHEGKKVKGDVEYPEPPVESPHLWYPPREALCCREGFIDPCEVPRNRGTTSYDLVTEEETAEAYVYKMDKPGLTADEVRVEIRRDRALWLIGGGDEPVKVKLRRNSEMRVREARASLSEDGVLTIVIPKRHRSLKWDEYADLVFIRFETVRVGVSS